MTNWDEPTSGVFEACYKDAEAFLADLEASSSLWESRPHEWIFRGHSDAEWLLLPAVHRRDSWKAFTPSGKTPFDPASVTEIERITQEGSVSREFKNALRACGIPEPFEHLGPGQLYGENAHLLAVAQHYGLPTRLLDWTRRSLVAAYFAAQKPDFMPKDLSVWALHAPSLKNHGDSRFHIKIVEALRSHNPNLHAQDGLFTHAGWAASYLCDGGLKPLTTELLPLDGLIGRIESSSRTRGGAPRVIMRKFVLSRGHDETLMALLAARRIFAGGLFPGLAGVTAAVRDRMRFAIPVPWELDD